jgi:transaldolase
LENGFAESCETLKQIAAGIDLDEAMNELQDEGVAGFAKSFENLTAALVKKHKELAGAAEAMKN